MRNDLRRRASRLIATAAVVSCLLFAGAAQAQWATNGSNINNTNSGNVGIGTTSPVAKLDVGGWTGIPGDVVGAWVNLGGQFGGDLYVGNVGTGVGRFRLSSNANEGFLQWNMYYNGSGYKSIDNTKASFEIDMTTTPEAIVFRRYPASSGLLSPTQLMSISATGLSVTGTVTATSGITAVYQDVAEWVPSKQELTPATVVVLDPSSPNEVMESSQAYDTTVAGVVSENPGLLLGKPGKEKAKVATTGRVRVRVDASQLPIHIGDLLVTSDIPGAAMRSVPVDLNGRKFHQPGTIIGKALEPLSEGQGEILVLLSLQ